MKESYFNGENNTIIIHSYYFELFYCFYFSIEITYLGPLIGIAESNQQILVSIGKTYRTIG